MPAKLASELANSGGGSAKFTGDGVVLITGAVVIMAAMTVCLRRIIVSMDSKLLRHKIFQLCENSDDKRTKYVSVPPWKR